MADFLGALPDVIKDYPWITSYVLFGVISLITGVLLLVATHVRRPWTYFLAGTLPVMWLCAPMILQGTELTVRLTVVNVFVDSLRSGFAHWYWMPMVLLYGVCLIYINRGTGRRLVIDHQVNKISPPWSAPDWAAWPAPTSVPTVTRIGNSGFQLAADGIKSLLFRLLATTPPGQLRLTFIDPVGLGQNATPFTSLADMADILSGKTMTISSIAR